MLFPFSDCFMATLWVLHWFAWTISECWFAWVHLFSTRLSRCQQWNLAWDWPLSPASSFHCKPVRSLRLQMRQSQWSPPGLKSRQKLSELSPVQLFQVEINSPRQTETIQLLKEKMFDDFDNGLPELIDLWSNTASKTVKEIRCHWCRVGGIFNWSQQFDAINGYRKPWVDK